MNSITSDKDDEFVTCCNCGAPNDIKDERCFQCHLDLSACRL